MRVVIDAKDVAAMSLERFDSQTTVDVPNPDCGIVGRGGEVGTVRGPCDIRQTLAVSLQRTHDLTRVCGP